MMWNETIIEITYENSNDLTDLIRSLFLAQEAVSNNERLNNSIETTGNTYRIKYSQNYYSDRNEVISSSRKLAEARPHDVFSLYAHCWNEGSGGNYTEEVYVKYRYGTFSYKFYSNSDLFITHNDSDEPPVPQLVEAYITQLFPKDDFAEEISDPGEREKYLGLSIIGENSFFINNGTLTEYRGSGEGAIIIPDGVTSIGKEISMGGGIFSGLAITSVLIPESVTIIGAYAFYQCKNLKDVILPTGVTCIGRSAFYECENLINVSIPEGVISIGDHAFRGTSLTKVSIPESVSFIGRGAFSVCRELKEVNIPNDISSIEDMTFIGCYALSAITIPESVTSIKDQAFRNCSGLTNLSIPESVTSIGDRAFSGCRNLRFVSLPKVIMDEFMNMKPDKFGKTALEGGIWSILCPAQQMHLFISKQGKAITSLYPKYLADDQVTPLAEELLKLFQNQLSTKECSTIAIFVSLFNSKLDRATIERFCRELELQKNGKKAVGEIKGNAEIIKTLNADQQ